jgi:stage V sporulation protein D (sporulation-specific penicillin-binding protein)
MASRNGWPIPPPVVEEDTEPAAQPQGTESETDTGFEIRPARPLVLIVIFTLVFLAVVARLVHWTIFPSMAAGPGAAAGPAAQSAEPMRGRIIDRNGLLLATDTFYGRVYANPANINKANQDDKAHRAGTTAVISATLALGQSYESVQASLALTTSTIMLTKRATVEQCDAIAELDETDEVWCDYERERAYPQGAVAAHVLGFLNYDRIGLYGVEARYDKWLNRALIWQGSLPEGGGEALPDNWQLYLPSPAGHDLMLNLDVPLQYMVERRLQEAVARYGAEGGTVIIMDPRTDAVLAMANYPTFDPGQYSDVPANTWVNSAISEIYEPGSVFKLVTMAAGVDSGYITPDSDFYDEGKLMIGGRTIQNAERKTWGRLTIREALAHSVNVVSAKVSLMMGAPTFYSYVRQFGFGRLTEVDLQSEVGGIVNQPGRGTDWSQFDQATNSFGQGISVTAFQMINAVAALANQGVLLQPQVVGAMIENGRVYRIPPRVLGRPIQPETARTLLQMMDYTVASASTPNPVPGYRVAGKTGTAEIPTKDGYTSLESITSFIGVLPAADPQLIVMVILVKPKVGAWAEQVAMPVFAQIGQDAVQMLEIKPDTRKP